MATFTIRSHFEAELRKLINAEIESGRDQLESMNHTGENAAFIRGQVRALRDMTDLIEAANEIIDKRNS